MEQNKSSRSIRTDVFLHNFFRVLKRTFWLPLVLAALLGGVRYLTLSRTYRPVYEAKANFAVSANNAGSSDISSVSYYYDSSAASMLATTFQYVLRTDATRQLLTE